MCRYAFKIYKPHFVCFDCRKQFKRPPVEDVIEQLGKTKLFKLLQQVHFHAGKRERAEREHGTTLRTLQEECRALVSRCPQCQARMADLGLDFKPPRSTNTRAWTRLRSMYEVGHAWHTCGCNGPGFVPVDAAGYDEYLADTRQLYADRIEAAQKSSKYTPAERAREVRHWTELVARIETLMLKPRGRGKPSGRARVTSRAQGSRPGSLDRRRQA
jgi:hypothetical protein